MSRRVAIGVHEIGRVLAGEQRFFLRPNSSFFCRVKEGDSLWIAEPFHLEKRFDRYAPTVARDLGAVPAFAADNTFNHRDLAKTHGQRHPARSLCREWHRAHIVITSRDEIPIEDLTDEDVAELGFSTRASFAAHWDKEAQLVGVVRYKVQHNPRVLRFGFRLVREPIAFAAKPAPKKREPKPLTQKSTSPAAKPAVVVAAEAPIVAPAPTPVAPPPRAPTPAPAVARPIGQQAPLGEIFSTEKGDAAFLAALKRERARGHMADAVIPRFPVRLRTIPAVMSPTGACPICGARFAVGCEHYPVTEAAE
jgi:hypothetical protein